jgi:hypothetical protein
MRWKLLNKLWRWDKARQSRWCFACRAVKGTKLKTEAMELLEKLPPTLKPCSNQSFTKNKWLLILRVKQLRYGMQGGQPASYSDKKYSRLFKEIMGVLTWVPTNANHSCRDRRVCLRYKRSFTNTTIRCITVSTSSIPENGNITNTVNTVRCIANCNTTRAVRICTRTSFHSIQGA